MMVDGCRGNNILDESDREGDDDEDPSWWDEESILMAFDLGYDEGGSGDTLLVSVQVGVVEQVRKMKKSWRRRLPAAMPYFHSKDFGTNDGGVFTRAGLGWNERNVLLNDLCGFIHTRLLGGVTASVSISKYETLTTQEFRSKHGTAYSYAIDMCMLSAYAIITAIGAKPEFNILIEDGHRNSKQALEILLRIKKNSEHALWKYIDEAVTDLKILNVGLGSKKDHPILQSADMLAYSEWQKMSHGDLTIPTALQKKGVRYRTSLVDIDEQLIKPFVEDGSRQVMLKRYWKAVRRYEEEYGIPEVQSDNEYDPPRRSKSGESCDGDGDQG